MNARFIKVGNSPTPPSGSDLHVWRILRSDPATLGKDEAAIAARILVPAAREGFVKARGGIRQVLARYLHCAPADVSMIRPENGKPRLAGGELEFNISHSGSEVCIAVARIPVGIDIEQSTRIVDAKAIAGRYFMPSESAAVAAAGDSHAAFLRIWVTKEAVVKMTGEGLAHALSCVETGPVVRVHGRPVSCQLFGFPGIIGCLAAAQEFEVKGWFEL